MEGTNVANDDRRRYSEPTDSVEALIARYKADAVDHPTWWPFSRAEADVLVAEVESLRVRLQQLTDAILDIDAHATEFAHDADGFTTTYVLSCGSLHRALGIVGHSAAPASEGTK